MNSLRQILFAAGSLLLGTPALGQRVTALADLRAFSEQRIRHQKTLGLTLGGYALANIAVSAVGASQTTGETKYFHRMNVYWNVVNLGIAGAGLLGSRRRRTDETLGQAVRQHENMKQLLLLNAGLDVAYVVGGGVRAGTRPEQARKGQSTAGLR